MGISLEDALALEQLERKLEAILPALYRDSYEDVLPVSMGSAPLKYDVDGNVAWDQMWGSFCDLAMAGGPPHRGSLLQPPSAEDSRAASDEYLQIAWEICRGVSLVTGLPAAPSQRDGWIEVFCSSAGMAAWLTRAIVMENVMARHEQATLFLPVGPEFRLNKEVKNVITVIAKTSHYWLKHTPAEQQRSIEEAFARLPADEVLMEPALHDEILAAPEAYRRVLGSICCAIELSMGLPCVKERYPGWVGVEYARVRQAIWVMRALIVANILARRENEVLFLPVSSRFEARDQVRRLTDTASNLHRLSIVARV